MELEKRTIKLRINAWFRLCGSFGIILKVLGIMIRLAILKDSQNNLARTDP
jgi:hypothetical protein